MPSTGLGFSFGAFERYFATNVAPTDDAVTFKDTTIDGKPAREGMDADATIDILISGDPTNASRIEVFGRDRQARPGAAFVALQWMFARNADLGDVYQVVDGSLTHAEITNADVKVTVDRLTASDWQYKFVVMPAYLATARQIGARD